LDENGFSIDAYIVHAQLLLTIEHNHTAGVAECTDPLGLVARSMMNGKDVLQVQNVILLRCKI
jgi:hypothetical protein